VPTILIVDRNGVVVYAREGVLNDDQQRELIGKVTSLR
jgi:predicted transcriptional regulator